MSVTPTPDPAPRARSHDAPATWVAAAAAAVDVALTVVFVVVGRSSHAEPSAVADVLATAWPFLAGLAVGWLAGTVWHRPLDPWPAGSVVLAGAVVGGLAIRWVSGGGIAPTFVLVTAVVLAVLLVGWRVAVARWRLRRRSASLHR